MRNLVYIVKICINTIFKNYIINITCDKIDQTQIIRYILLRKFNFLLTEQ